jgi:hypothetical protein
MGKVYEHTENGVTTKKAAQLTDTMKDALTKLSYKGWAFAGWSTWRALQRRGLVTANTAPKDMTQGVWCHYMLTDAGRDVVRTLDASKDIEALAITWMNKDGVYSEPFRADYFRVDPLGYLDALRKGGRMEDVHVTDGAGRDVTSAHFG